MRSQKLFFVVFVVLASAVNSARSGDIINPSGLCEQKDSICLPRGECDIAKGTKLEECSQGFGECCKLTATCNGTNTNVEISHEIVEITSTSNENECTFTILQKPDYCQVRLDFVEFNSQSANFNGSCKNDSLTISGSFTVAQGFQVCGTLTGQHMYLAFGGTGKCGGIELRPYFEKARSYRIIATQIPCNSPQRVPDHCLQHFNSTRGTVKSFDWPNQQQNDQEYTICVDGSRGDSQISWKPCSGESQNPFLIKGPEFVPSNRCELDEDWVQINGHNRMCTFSNTTTVVSNFKPFLLNVHFNGREFVEFPFYNEILQLPQSQCTNAILTMNPAWSLYYNECYWDPSITAPQKCRCDLNSAATPLLGTTDVANTGFCLDYHQK